jgi:hypothetical protein
VSYEENFKLKIGEIAVNDYIEYKKNSWVMERKIKTHVYMYAIPRTLL